MKPPKRQRKSINKAQTTQRSTAKRQKTPNYVKNQTANASDGTADHAVPGPSFSRDGSSSTTQNPSSSRVDMILNTENQSTGVPNMDQFHDMSDHPARTDQDQQRSFRPSTGSIVNPELTTTYRQHNGFVQWNKHARWITYPAISVGVDKLRTYIPECPTTRYVYQ